MFDTISEGFKSARQALSGKATLTAENIAPALESIRRSLLDADVDYEVSKGFLNRVKDKALGTEISVRAGKGQDRKRISPGDYFTSICEDELTALMGPVDDKISFANGRPTVILMVGLQGSGKTTSTAKLTKLLQTEYKRKPLLVAADIYRPAAIQQLKVLGQKLNAPVFSLEGAKPTEIATKALAHARENGFDTVLIDTAGRVTVDDALMQELSDIKTLVKPDHIYLVLDAMIGQDAVRTASAFNDRLDISDVIITKLDGDARGGAALSVKQVVGKAIKFVGTGEDLARLESFRPEGMASRILGMGDVVGLVKDFEKVVDKDREDETMRMLQGQFSFKDFYEQISMIQKMGSLKDLIAKLPMQGMIPKGVNVDDGELLKIKTMIDSMSEQERLRPQVLNASRVRRIALGSGRKEKEVQDLITKFKSMQQMMGKMGKGLGMLGKIPGMGGLAQMGQMKQMAQNMMGGGGMGGMGSMFGNPFAMPNAEGSIPRASSAERDRLRDKRKAAKKARKKNRK